MLLYCNSFTNITSHMLLTYHINFQTFLFFKCILEVPTQISHLMKNSLACHPVKNTDKHEN